MEEKIGFVMRRMDRVLILNRPVEIINDSKFPSNLDKFHGNFHLDPLFQETNRPIFQAKFRSAVEQEGGKNEGPPRYVRPVI